MIKFNDQQLDAIKKCVEWYFTKTHIYPFFAIGGLAGTGKSTVVSIIIKLLGVPLQDVVFATLTGKASLVLRLKGNPSNTIHKTFYSVYKSKKSFVFSKKHRIPSNIRLIVIDEVSMINQNMLEDILSFGIPVIVLGDYNQLKPIFGSNIFLEDPNNFNVFLTQVMRQNDTSGILDLADMSRNNEPISLGQYKQSKAITMEEFLNDVTKYDVVLCYANKTRRILNNYIREQLGYKTVFPVKGEKVLCLMNNYNYELEYMDIPIYIINGMLGIVTKDAYQIDEDGLELLNLEFIPDFLVDQDNSNLKFNSKCFREPFEQYRKDITKEAFIEALYNDTIEDDALEDILMVDFGYAFTVHKSQGSQFDHVAVLVSDYRGSGEAFKNWLYTAITRGVKSVTLIYDI